MKITKTLKTLKFWSKKKKKKKLTTTHHHQHPPPPCCCTHTHHHHHRTLPPSAPPLPPWLDYEQQTYNQHLLTAEVNFSQESSALPVSYQAQFDPREHDISNIRAESGVVNASCSSASGDVGTGCSYQQYMVENPVYAVPVLPLSRETERSAGAVGCVVNVGAHLFRCFFPCFRIRDAHSDFNF